MKLMKIARKYGSAAVAGVVVSGSVLADVPAGVSTAITTAGTDAVTVATACFVAVIGLLGFKYMRHAAK